MKLKKGIPVIDQGNKLGFWGNKFGGCLLYTSDAADES